MADDSKDTEFYAAAVNAWYATSLELGPPRTR